MKNSRIFICFAEIFFINNKSLLNLSENDVKTAK